MTAEVLTTQNVPNSSDSDLKQNKKRGRKIKYNTKEEKIEARRKQQKEYRERKKKELIELKEFKKQHSPKD